MREVWKEIWEGLDARLVLAALLFIAFIISCACYLRRSFSRSNDQIDHKNTDISRPIINHIQTNFTS